MKLLAKIMEAVKKETGAYSEQKKRNLIVRFMIAFAVLIVMNFYLNYLNFFRVKEHAQKQEIQTTQGIEQLMDKPITHQKMISNLQQMKTDIQKQKITYEKNSR